MEKNIWNKLEDRLNGRVFTIVVLAVMAVGFVVAVATMFFPSIRWTLNPTLYVVFGGALFLRGLFALINRFKVKA